MVSVFALLFGSLVVTSENYILILDYWRNFLMHINYLARKVQLQRGRYNGVQMVAYYHN